MLLQSSHQSESCLTWRRLTAEARAEIPTFVVLRRVLLTAWLASHREVPLACEIGRSYTAGTVAIAQELLREEYLVSALV